MGLKPLEAKKEEFEKAGVKTLPLPKGPRVKRGSDDDASTCKILMFGPTGSGKTRALLGLLLHGLKLFIISTDMGGEGLDTVKLELKRMGRHDLLDNYVFVILDTFDQVRQFCDSPAKIYPQIYDEGFDFLIWEGFTGYQAQILFDHVADSTPVGGDKRELSDARSDGLVLEQTDWGSIKTGTTQYLNKFLKLYNLKTGQVFHKVVNCLEGIKSVKTGDKQTTYVETREPMLQGAGQKLIGPAFDLILKTAIVKADTKDEGERSFKYICSGHDALSGPKKRGLELPDVMDGDMYKLWAEIAKQKGIKQGAVSKEFEKENETSG